MVFLDFWVISEINLERANILFAYDDASNYPLIIVNITLQYLVVSRTIPILNTTWDSWQYLLSISLKEILFDVNIEFSRSHNIRLYAHKLSVLRSLTQQYLGRESASSFSQRALQGSGCTAIASRWQLLFHFLLNWRVHPESAHGHRE